MKNCTGAVSFSDTPAVPVAQVLSSLLSNPVELLVRRWNWKSALLSSLWRRNIFLLVNLHAGPEAAMGGDAGEILFPRRDSRLLWSAHAGIPVSGTRLGSFGGGDDRNSPGLSCH